MSRGPLPHRVQVAGTTVERSYFYPAMCKVLLPRCLGLPTWVPGLAALWKAVTCNLSIRCSWRVSARHTASSAAP